MRKNVKGVSDSIDVIGWTFPSQEAEGAHMNLSGAGVAAHAPNKENAIKFLEYLASDSAQKYFSGGNDEIPGCRRCRGCTKRRGLGHVQSRRCCVVDVAENLPTAQKIFNAVGWK